MACPENCTSTSYFAYASGNSDTSPGSFCSSESTLSWGYIPSEKTLGNLFKEIKEKNNKHHKKQNKIKGIEIIHKCVSIIGREVIFNINEYSYIFKNNIIKYLSKNLSRRKKGKIISITEFVDQISFRDIDKMINKCKYILNQMINEIQKEQEIQDRINDLDKKINNHTSQDEEKPNIESEIKPKIVNDLKGTIDALVKEVKHKDSRIEKQKKKIQHLEKYISSKLQTVTVRKDNNSEIFVYNPGSLDDPYYVKNTEKHDSGAIRFPIGKKTTDATPYSINNYTTDCTTKDLSDTKDDD